MPDILRTIIISLAMVPVVYIGIAVVLILSQSPAPLGTTKSISFTSLPDLSDQPEVPVSSIPARDGSTIRFRHLPAAPEAPLAIVVHGSGGNGQAYMPIARALAGDGAMEVLVPDLRGHGENPILRGDVDYIGQLEDDLADLIRAHGGAARDVFMVGHSSGGGLVIRFAGGAEGKLLDRAVLIAPFLNYKAPTNRDRSGGWAHPLTRRLIGLSMLNTIGITWLNHLTCIQFNFPDEVLNSSRGRAVTQAYSFRLNTSYAPRNDYLSDIAALPEFLLLVGEKDDAFLPEMYEPTMSKATSAGKYVIVPDADHIGILTDPNTLQQVRRFLRSDRP